jgi:hypothetical protein
MAKYVYYLEVYIEGEFYGTYGVTPQQLRSGNYSLKLEEAYALFPEFEDIIKKRLREVNDNRARFFSLPGEPTVKVRYYRDEPPWPYGHRKGPEPAPQGLGWTACAEGATYILISESFRFISKEIAVPPKDVWLGPRVERLVGEAGARFYDVEYDYFHPAKGGADIPAKISNAAERIISGDDKRFHRIIILAHSGAEIRLENKVRKSEDTGEEEEYYDWKDFGPGISYKPIEASTVIGIVSPYIKPGGYLFIAACRQWTCSWQYKAEELGADITAVAVPGEGECLELPQDESWWETFERRLFP